jgi:hypothetical protein
MPLDPCKSLQVGSRRLSPGCGLKSRLRVKWVPHGRITAYA